MNITDFKAGQPEDRYQYKAFLPERISHELVVAEDPELSELLGRADRALGELNAFAQLILDIENLHPHVCREGSDPIQPH